MYLLQFGIRNICLPIEQLIWLLFYVPWQFYNCMIDFFFFFHKTWSWTSILCLLKYTLYGIILYISLIPGVSGYMAVCDQKHK